MLRFTGLALVSGLALLCVVLAGGCSQPEPPVDPSSQALAYLHEHKYDEAIRSASEAIQQSPNSAEAYLYRGRAYYNRAAMGDAHRAIEDLSQAVRLAPDSSDAYYYRALIYRELGQTDLADRDDARARELDHVSREAFEALPDTTPRLDLSKLKVPPADSKTKDAPKTAAEMLKESAAADAKAKSTAQSGDEFVESLSDEAGAETPAPVESAFNKQYRALLGQSAPGEESPLPGGPLKDAFGRPLDGAEGSAATGPAASNAAPLPATEEAAPGAARGAGMWSRGTAPPLQSPFARPALGQGAAPTTGTTPGMLPTVQSPFPRATRGATGYVAPVSPFGGPGGQASGAAGVSRPFSPPATTVRPQNNAIRPAYPRDYLP